MHRKAWIKAATMLLTLATCHCGPRLCVVQRNLQLNYRPIIGVLAQENRSADEFAQGSSYIAASYIKYLEGAGARVAPIRMGLKDKEYVRLFYSINGLLLPGGDIDLHTSNSNRVARIFYRLALRANNTKDYFPIWGICQGFQQLSFFTANKYLLTQTNTKGVALPLNFTQEAQSSRLFQSLPSDVLQCLAKENITSNFHKYSLSMQNYTENPKLRMFYRILSTNIDKGVEFISTMEGYRYPFYALQWHPEKCPYEWVDKPGMVHTTSATRTCFYTACFFISEAIKNSHRFSCPKEEEKALIYNYPPFFTSMDAIFIQNYYFD
ncbi:zgc:171566 [Solea solea]|uniref:zgc:171566 n=1 Tax=Solea solea TaxID=90069 RepID=UPI00272A57E7|nr:zgc:171566 [Solea solea]